MPTTATRRKRPHPARRSRKLAGAVSVATMFVLTGCMAATTRAKNTGSGSTATPTTATSTTPVYSYAFSDDDGSVTSRSTNVAAVPATASAQPITVTRAS